ncbi:MAG: PD-(D/E)XK nuclease family transposase, partial [Marinilabiliaceae bacterium]|nr:PD-(D/E)XK nuclease family transposase [Marinilabiliaceae bacterium]
YISRLINSQSVKGKDWNFELPKIYSLNILDFTFEEAMLPLDKEVKRTEETKFVSKVQLLDCETKEVFYDKLTFIYIELPRFTKELNDLKTFFEQWIYIIKHLHELEELPSNFRKEKIFKSLFETAKIARMSKKEVNNYLKDLNNMNIVRNEIRSRDKIIAMHAKTIAKHVNIIAQKNNALAQKDNALAQHVNIIAQKDNALAQHVNIIAQKDNALAQKNNALLALQRKVDDYEKKFGAINGTKVL